MCSPLDDDVREAEVSPIGLRRSARPDLAGPQQIVGALHLHQADRRLDVSHPVVESQLSKRGQETAVPVECRCRSSGLAVIAQAPGSPARPESEVVSIPPSPVVMAFRGWELKRPAVPNVPACRSPTRAPNPQAASSTTHNPCFAARAFIRSMSAHSPNRCTGMIPTVRSLIAASASAQSMLKVSGSMSTNTGVAPAYSTTFGVAIR